MGQFFAFFKTIWELIKTFKQIRKYFNDIYIKKLEDNQKVKAEANRIATDSIEADQQKPVSQQSDDTLIEAHRKRSE